MMKFFRCNCTTVEQGIEFPSAILYVDHIHLKSMNAEKVIGLRMDVTAFLEGFQLNRDADCLYLYDVNGINDDVSHCFTKLNQNFYISLNKQDDSSQQFSLNLNLSVYEGCYKLVYLQSKCDHYCNGDELFGEWEIMGTSQQITIELQQNKDVTSSTDLKDVTNFVVQKNKNNISDPEDENPKIKYSQSKIPKLKRKR